MGDLWISICVEELEGRPAGVLLDVARWSRAAARNSGQLTTPSPSQSMFFIVSCKLGGVSVIAAIPKLTFIFVMVSVPPLLASKADLAFWSSVLAPTGHAQCDSDNNKNYYYYWWWQDRVMVNTTQ